MFMKKLSIALLGAAFYMTLAVSEGSAQGARYWRGDNGRHLGWNRADRGRRGRVVTYRSVERYYRPYYPRAYSPRYVYRTYPRYYTTYSPRYIYSPYRVYPRFRSYPRSGLSVRFNLGW